MLSLHLALLPQGVWFDEYYTFGTYRLYGMAAFTHRLLHWGPRPLSESLIWLYWLAVRSTGQVLMAPALIVAWSIAGGFLCAAVAPWRRPGRLARLALLLGLPSLALLGAPVGELFYWPMGSLAYLPALGAASWVTLRAAGPGLRTGCDHLAVSCVLIAGALSVELGGLLAGVSAVPLMMLALAARRHAAGKALPFVTAAAPLAVAATIFGMLLHGRMAAGDTSLASSIYAGHPWASLGAAFVTAGQEIVAPPGMTAGTAILTKLLLLAGVRQCLAQAWPAAPPRAPLLAIMIGLAGCFLLSIAASYYQFGSLCCERHASFRQFLLVLGLVGAAGLWRPGSTLAPPAWPSVMWALGPALLAMALLPALPARIADMRQQFALGPARMAARKATFVSGRLPGTLPLRFVIAPAGPLIGRYNIAPGQYSRPPDPAWFVVGPMLFFGRQQLIAVRSH